jgi:hypothetical protein
MRDYTGRVDQRAEDRTVAAFMRRFLRPSRKKIVIAAVIPLLSLFFFLLLFGAPPIGLRLCGGCVEEDGQTVCYDYFCIEGPYTISIILSHLPSPTPNMGGNVAICGTLTLRYALNTASQ